MGFKTLRDIHLQGQRVLLRADLNVPTKGGIVTDLTRITRLKPTIDFLSQSGAITFILSHFGRPAHIPSPEYSLKFLIPTLEKSWGKSIAFCNDCIGEDAIKFTKVQTEGSITLLENVRFHEGEEQNDPAFSHALSQLGDIYVNDAFSVSHRAHASTIGLTNILPCAAGFLMEQELKALSSALEKPEHPVAAVIGGAKVSTKIDVLNNLINRVDIMILGGGMANTFLYALGHTLGKSLCEKDMAETANSILAKAITSNCEIILPVDLNYAPAFAGGQKAQTASVTEFPDDMMALDIGPQSIKMICRKLDRCKTILWNGPLGAFEIPPFNQATFEIARHAAQLTKNGKAMTIGGGGDTVSALESALVADQFSYISTAGGAFLEWLEGKELPGVKALNIKH